MRIRDPGWKKVRSGIRDKHPGSATLQMVYLYIEEENSVKQKYGISKQKIIFMEEKYFN
jgi:hypothetical protein